MNVDMKGFLTINERMNEHNKGYYQLYNVRITLKV